MPIRSRRTEVHRVDVVNDAGVTLTVCVRALRPSEEAWILDRHLEAKDATDLRNWVPTNLYSFAMDYVRLGLVEVNGAIDPDTGKPLELKWSSVKIGQRSVEVVQDDSLDAVAEWIAPIFDEIQKLTHLSPEEKKGINFTSPSQGQSDSRSAPNAAETNPIVPSTASNTE